MHRGGPVHDTAQFCHAFQTANQGIAGIDPRLANIIGSRKTVILITHSIAEAVYLADKVYIMSARPGQISRVVDVPFARPRSLDLMETREFFDLVNLIKHDIQHQPTAPNAAKGAA